ncbi:MAG: chorismate-binding protein, partial [Smithellaceae bacterium]|nr:chorismate-binding protein [Smithellaceae bacterium]
PRGLTRKEDDELALGLRFSEKNRAENVMIVDMIRNDLGRVARPGSVQVESLFDVERYPTLWQMTSTVSAETEASFCEIMRAMFPCASITGAPKKRTMEIIAELETVPRRIYTGCIGFLAPGRRSQFNVAIRTILIDKNENTAEYGSGGGIVWDSICADEYGECLLKAQVLKGRPAFSLLESLLWTPEDGYSLLEPHLARLGDSACYFSFPFDPDLARMRLETEAERFSREPRKVRLILARDGSLTCHAEVLDAEQMKGSVTLKLSREPVDAADIFLYHKTTRRKVFDAAREGLTDCDDVLLWNDRGEITETCTANFIARIRDRLVTPPVSCGLLAGTYRSWLISQGAISERIITKEDLESCTELYVINSVRGQRKAILR